MASHYFEKTVEPEAVEGDVWEADTLTALTDLGKGDLMKRRHFLNSAVYSVAGLAIPDQTWWRETAKRTPSRRSVTGQRIGRGDIEAIREMTAFIQHHDQRHGGGHGRSAAVAYLIDEVTPALNGVTSNAQVRHELFSAAGDLLTGLPRSVLRVAGC